MPSDCGGKGAHARFRNPRAAGDDPTGNDDVPHLAGMVPGGAAAGPSRRAAGRLRIRQGGGAMGAAPGKGGALCRAACVSAIEDVVTERRDLLAAAEEAVG
ncbi:MAG: hypothetical protein JWL91_735 [Sphingomonas bacterium]|nr:hypothetical protein [Sphingomonas bacterium]